ncbi:MAG: FAD-dependent oxidoreductase [Alphaproteobacteria bacterium]|nr:FAD-dependent oxidoreductase [Alphaproteobacteria bacterium]
MDRLKIIIAGAGIGGLTAALCLARAGHNVTIYEKATELKEVGAGIQLSAPAGHVLRHIGLANQLRPLEVRPEFW